MVVIIVKIVVFSLHISGHQIKFSISGANSPPYHLSFCNKDFVSHFKLLNASLKVFAQRTKSVPR